MLIAVQTIIYKLLTTPIHLRIGIIVVVESLCCTHHRLSPRQAPGLRTLRIAPEPAAR